MTEFFNHLVSRHTSPKEKSSGEFLRPRLPSLFEDPGAAGFEWTSFQADPGKAAPQRGSASGVEGQDYLNPSVESRWRAPAAENQVDPGQDPGQPIHSRKNNRADIRQVAGSRQLHAREPGIPVGLETTISPVSRSESGEKEKRAPIEHGSSQLLNGPEIDSREGGLMFRPDLEPLRPLPPVNPTSPLGDAGRSVPEPGSFRGMREETPGPTIHISIGRIEVRAVTPAGQPPVRQAPPPRPKLTLDEYLRQRNKGER